MLPKGKGAGKRRTQDLLYKKYDNIKYTWETNGARSPEAAQRNPVALNLTLQRRWRMAMTTCCTSPL
jgi:hypothetical protein